MRCLTCIGGSCSRQGHPAHCAGRPKSIMFSLPQSRSGSICFANLHPSPDCSRSVPCYPCLTPVQSARLSLQKSLAKTRPTCYNTKAKSPCTRSLADKVFDSDSKDRGFKSRRVRHQRTPMLIQCRSSFILQFLGVGDANMGLYVRKSAQFRLCYARLVWFLAKTNFIPSPLPRSRSLFKLLDRRFPRQKMNTPDISLHRVRF